MIALDTNFLILGLVRGSPQDNRLRQWLQTGEPLVVSVLVWAAPRKSGGLLDCRHLPPAERGHRYGERYRLPPV